MRLVFFLSILVFAFPNFLLSQFDTSQLIKTVVDTDLGVQLFYVDSLVDLKLIKLDALPEYHAFYDPDNDDDNGIYVMDVRFGESELLTFHVVYWPGYSVDPVFYFYHPEDLEVPIYIVEGMNLYIPGGGIFYTSGHINSFFDLRQKYSAIDGKFRHHRQNYQYVGLKTKALIDLELLEFPNGDITVTTVKAGENIEVLISAISDQGYNVFLIKNDFGIVGWYELTVDGFYGAHIESLFFRGD